MHKRSRYGPKDRKVTTFDDIGIDPTPREVLSDKTKGEFYDTEDVYNENQRGEQMEEDELRPEEAGFMDGYDNMRRVEQAVNAEFRNKKNEPKSTPTSPISRRQLREQAQEIDDQK